MDLKWSILLLCIVCVAWGVMEFVDLFRHNYIGAVADILICVFVSRLILAELQEL